MSDVKPDTLLTANQVAHSWAGDVFAEDSDAADQLRLAFGLLDLLDEYWVTREIRFANDDSEGSLPADVLWDGYRRRLEADRDAEAVTYSLWVDWFEDHATSATAFAEVLGNDIDRVVAERSEALLRRARRVLECSGPVRWTVKEPAYRIAVRLPALLPAEGVRVSLGLVQPVGQAVEFPFAEPDGGPMNPLLIRSDVRLQSRSNVGRSAFFGRSTTLAVPRVLGIPRGPWTVSPTDTSLKVSNQQGGIAECGTV
ncbi:hypothetical protein [Streptomyces sp. NPDC004976]